jgi:hypothetical protein
MARAKDSIKKSFVITKSPKKVLAKNWLTVRNRQKQLSGNRNSRKTAYFQHDQMLGAAASLSSPPRNRFWYFVSTWFSGAMGCHASRLREHAPLIRSFFVVQLMAMPRGHGTQPET